MEGKASLLLLCPVPEACSSFPLYPPSLLGKLNRLMRGEGVEGRGGGGSSSDKGFCAGEHQGILTGPVWEHKDIEMIEMEVRRG